MITQIILFVVASIVGFILGRSSQKKTQGIFVEEELIYVQVDNSPKFLKKLNITRSGQFGLDNLYRVMDFVVLLIATIKKLKSQQSFNLFETIIQVKELLPGIVNLVKYSGHILNEMKDLQGEEYLKLIDYAIRISGHTIGEKTIKNVLEGFRRIAN